MSAAAASKLHPHYYDFVGTFTDTLTGVCTHTHTHTLCRILEINLAIGRTSHMLSLSLSPTHMQTQSRFLS